jgi:hypothetical protein
LWKSAKWRAKVKGIHFDLKVTDIPTIPKLCPILRLPLRTTVNKHGPGSPSLDRINPKRGYVVGNIQVISHRANTIKNDATWQEVASVAQYMKQHEHNKR